MHLSTNPQLHSTLISNSQSTLDKVGRMSINPLPWIIDGNYTAFTRVILFIFRERTFFVQRKKISARIACPDILDDLVLTSPLSEVEVGWDWQQMYKIVDYFV